MAKVLLVSERGPLYRRISRLFTQEGIELIHAKDRTESITAFRQYQPKVAIIDITMTSHSGLEIGREMASAESEIRIVMLSNLDTTDMRNQAVRSGARDLLIQPFSDAEFLFTINLYLEGLLEGAT